FQGSGCATFGAPSEADISLPPLEPRMFLALTSLLLLCASAAYAQATLGAITGVVKDSSGAIIQAVKVQVTNEATGLAEVIQSQADGVSVPPPLPAGTYRISATATGFKQVEIAGLKVDVGTTLTQDIALELGQVTETIKVEGQTSLVETTTGNVG